VTDKELVERTVERLIGDPVKDSLNWMGHEICGAKGPENYFTCTRTKGHWSDHIAGSIGNEIVCRWKQGESFNDQ